MNHFEMIGKWLLVAGLALAAVGGLVWLLGRVFKLDELPGTIRIEGSGFTCVVPVLASLVISVILTILLNWIIRVLNK